MNCPKCGVPNEPGVEECQVCGAEMPPNCKGCGNKVPKGVDLCILCRTGKTKEAPAPATPAQADFVVPDVELPEGVDFESPFRYPVQD